MRSENFRYYLVTGRGRVPAAISRFLAEQRSIDVRITKFIEDYGCRSLVIDELGNVKGVTFDEKPNELEWTEHTEKDFGPYFVPNFDTEAGLKINDELPQYVPSAEQFGKAAGISHLTVTTEIGTFIRQCGFQQHGGHIIVFQPIDGEREAVIEDKTGLLELSREDLVRLGVDI